LFSKEGFLQATRRVFIILIWFAISSGRLAIAVPQNPAADTHDKDRVSIAQTVANFVNAWNIHDAHAFAMTFTEDADFTNVVGTHASGRANIEAFHAPMFAGIFKDSHQTAQVRSIRFLRPDLASVDVDWQMTGAKTPDGALRPQRKGLSDFVMARQSDGSWLIQVMHNAELTNSVPAPPAK
jgi:uncharacterized protein (TIGR02246 family)